MAARVGVMGAARWRAATTALPLLLAWCATLPVQGSEPRPYRLAVEVVSPDHSVRERLREEVEGELIRRLDVAGCFASVGPAAGAPRAADLLLRAALAEFNDETRYHISQAARDDPRAPPEVKQALDVLLEVDLELQLLRLPERQQVRLRRQHVSETYRPLMLEDPRAEAAYKLVDALAEAGRRFSCKGSAKKLEREIRGAETRAPR